MNPVGFFLVFLIRLYRKLVSPVLTALFGPLGMGCRFTPTCSVYALEALQTHGTLRGGRLALRRLCRCHPWGSSGDDPVPARGALCSGTQSFEAGGDEAIPSSRQRQPSSPRLNAGGHFPD